MAATKSQEWAMPDVDRAFGGRIVDRPIPHSAQVLRPATAHSLMESGRDSVNPLAHAPGI